MMKKPKAERMRRRSSQSAFSRAVMSCLEVLMRLLSMSCVVEADCIVAVDDATNPGH